MPTLSDRMKEYERAYDIQMTRRIPIIIRLDGRAFHSWTRRVGCKKPFDDGLMELMANTTKYLCENISGCIFGYTQSDEISLLVVNNQNNNSQAWFENRIQKMVSISSSLATYFFNNNSPFERDVPAFFDSRVFILPKFEIKNYFLWRQRDAEKNSISSLAQSLYSHRELQHKNSSDKQEMCFQKGINWNNLYTPKKRGYAIYKTPFIIQNKDGEEITRNKFIIDENIPIFSDSECDLFVKIFEYEKEENKSN